MSIAEKLTTIAENEQKVYKAGQSSMVDESKIIEKTVTGTNIVVIDDTSEIPHDVGCKVESVNLFNVNGSLTDSVGWTTGETTLVDGKIKTTSNYANGTGKGQFIDVQPNMKYTISYKIDSMEREGALGGIWVFTSGGSKIHYDSDHVLYSGGSYHFTITTPSNVNKIWLSFNGCADSDDKTIRQYIIYDKVQLNEGDTALPYTPYVDVSGVTVTRCGKNLIPFPYPLFKDTVTTNGITATLQDDGGILLNGTSTSYVYINLARLNLGTVNVLPSKNDSGFISNSVDVAGVTVRYDPNGQLIFIMLVAGITCDNLVVYPQIEKGTVSTDFELGVNNKTYTPNADGTVDGIKSLCPVMTISTDVDGVGLTVDYHKSWGKTEADLKLWEMLTSSGKRTTYSYVFRQTDFTGYTFPKPIVPTVGSDRMFYNYYGTALPGNVDFSQMPDGTYGQYQIFQHSMNLLEIDPFNAPASGHYNGTWGTCPALKRLIGVNSMESTVFSSTFSGCSSLEEVTFCGVIGQNISLSACPLNAASITNIINVLSETATDKTLTLKLTAVQNAFETSSGAADGNTSEEWLNLAATKSNWTITLA